MNSVHKVGSRVSGRARDSNPPSTPQTLHSSQPASVRGFAKRPGGAGNGNKGRGRLGDWLTSHTGKVSRRWTRRGICHSVNNVHQTRRGVGHECTQLAWLASCICLLGRSLEWLSALQQSTVRFRPLISRKTLRDWDVHERCREYFLFLALLSRPPPPRRRGTARFLRRELNVRGKSLQER